MRARNGKVHLNRRKKLLKQAKGFRGARHRLQKAAQQAVLKAGMHAYVSRRQKKREMRALWIVRINAAARENGVSYSKLMNNLNKAGVAMDRKSLAEIAYSDPAAFKSLVEATS